MRALSFELSGKTACLRKPDVNQFAYFTYNNIHKPALLGLLGAIVGYRGYTQLHDQKEHMKAKQKMLKGKEKEVLQEKLDELDTQLPEFYDKLQHLKIAITPLAPFGYFSKKIHVFNNSVGYASKEEGGNLIVREQWLENPKWQIMILNDESLAYEKIKTYLTQQKAVFIPYLGKNDHPAKIENVHEMMLDDSLHAVDGEYYIDSLFIEPEKGFGYHRENDTQPFLFREVSPVRLQKKYHFYEYETLVFTNYEPKKIPKDTYCYEQKNYTFI